MKPSGKSMFWAVSVGLVCKNLVVILVLLSGNISIMLKNSVVTFFGTFCVAETQLSENTIRKIKKLIKRV